MEGRRMPLITDPPGTVVFPPDIRRTYEPTGPTWEPDTEACLVVSVVIHAPSYQDTPPPGAIKPQSMQGGVGRDTAEPRHGQLARLSQWDFGLTVGLWRLLTIAEDAGIPVAVALDSAGVTTMPGLAQGAAARAQEIVVRGAAANVIVGDSMTADAERRYIQEATATVAQATGTTPTGWFGPERGQSRRTPELLAEAGYRWFGDWPVDERPVHLEGQAQGLTALPHALDTEDMFSLFTRSVTADAYTQILDQTVDQLVADSALGGTRYLGLSLFGWVSGQACFADVIEHFLHRLAGDPNVLIATPSQVVSL
jgi:hypothetical protein